MDYVQLGRIAPRDPGLTSRLTSLRVRHRPWGRPCWMKRYGGKIIRRVPQFLPRSVSDEAIHCHFCSISGLLRFARNDGRARIRATRWLAMTVSQLFKNWIRTLRELAAALDQRQEHPAHLGLGFPHPRLERRKVRRVAGPRHHPQKIFP